MATPYLSEIKIFGFNFPPLGWAQCNGQLLSIASNSALFSLLGTTYGGDGRTTFGLPDFRGRVPMHVGTGFNLGSQAGVEAVSLIAAQIPAHTHTVKASAATVDQTSPSGNLWGSGAAEQGFNAAGGGAMNAGAISNTGSGQPHENRMPYLVLNICIAVQGIFPSRN